MTKLQKNYEQRALEAEEKLKQSEARLEEIRTLCHNLKVRLIARFGVAACKKVIANDDELMALARFAERTDKKEPGK